MEDKLENLKKIKKVEVPPFLFTRIQSRIESLQYAPTSWRWSFAACMLLVFGLNATVAIQSAREENGFGEVVSAMHLSTSNNLYDE